MKKTSTALALVTLIFCGCGSINKQYVAADRATYQAISAEYAAYVIQDQRLSGAEKERRRRKLDAWKTRLQAAESK